MNYESKYDVNERVNFSPNERQYRMYGIQKQTLEGRIMSVRFTANSMLFDIVDADYGKMFENVEIGAINYSYDKPEAMPEQAEEPVYEKYQALSKEDVEKAFAEYNKKNEDTFIWDSKLPDQENIEIPTVQSYKAWSQ